MFIYHVNKEKPLKMTGHKTHMEMAMPGNTEDSKPNKPTEDTEETNFCRSFTKLVREQHV